MAEEGFSVNDFDHLENAQDVAYGLYDTWHNCWLGDENGPKLFTRADSEKMKGMPQELMARISAQMTAVQLGWTPGRLQSREYHGDPLVKKDTVDTKMTAVEALRKIEGCDDGSTDGE
jgi:hypothetical protein